MVEEGKPAPDFELSTDNGARDSFFKRDRKGREMHLSPEQSSVWREAVGRGRVANRLMPLAGATGAPAYVIGPFRDA